MIKEIIFKQGPGLKSLAAAAVKAFRASEAMSKGLVNLPESTMYQGRLQKLQVGLRVALGDKARADRIYSRVLAEASGKVNFDEFILEELEFEIRYGLAGEKMVVDSAIMRDLHKRPHLWRSRQARNRS